MADKPTGKLGILVGGGPAPGINGVISAATIEARNQGMEVIGFRDGYKWLAEGDATQWQPLDIDDVSGIHIKGGSILGTSRANPTKSEEQMTNLLDVLHRLQVSALVTIGGDDTGYTASQVYRHAAGSIRVAHVPKTIDNDLPLPGSTPTFGFETARHYGTQLLRNLAEDAKTTSRWYLIVSMGRAAGHLALGIGKASAATITIIPEEFRNQKVTVDLVCDVIMGAIIKRKSQNAHYGVVVLAEGLIESIGDKGLLDALGAENISQYGRLDRDPHGLIRLGEIEFHRIVRDRLQPQLEQMGLRTTFIMKVLGYELRSAEPIPFDAEYTRDLGYGAVKFLRSEKSLQYGAVISFVQGRMEPLPFDTMIDPTTKRMQVRRVNVYAESYESARRYMIRLEREDFESPAQLERLAKVVGMTPEQFRKRFGYVVGLTD
jgi:6-phosphofructokinase 1